MMNFSFLSPNTIACIARGAFRLEQTFGYYPDDYERDSGYRVVVNYPNGYGASITCPYPSQDAGDNKWRVDLYKGGKTLYESGNQLVKILADRITEDEVVQICDSIYFM